MDGPPGVDVESVPVATGAPVPTPIPASSLVPAVDTTTSEEPKHDATQPIADPLADSGDEDDDDDVEVTIGVIPPVNVQYSLKGPLDANGDAIPAGKLDIDAVPTINDKPIYDIDLAQMEDRPWRKPGADITDYFNYGFTEDTWNTYCERQKKLRQEYSNQAAVNKALFSSINLSNPLGMPPTTTGGRQLVPLTEGTVKVLTDNGGIFKPHYHKLATDNSEPIMRTVIGAPPPTSAPPGPPGVTPTNATAPIVDFSKPPPNLPPPAAATPAPATLPPVHIMDGPPGVDIIAPPGVDGPPGVDMEPQTIPTLGSGSGLDMSVPPPGFNPSLPPPGMRPPQMGIPMTNMPPPGFSTMLPPPGFGQGRFPPGGPGGMNRPPPLMGRDFDSMGRRESGDFDDLDDDRRRHKRRSRSRSPRRDSSFRRVRDSGRDRERDDRRDRDKDRDKERDKERDKDRDREKDRERERGTERSERSRRHRSRSGSPDTRKRREERDKDKKRDRRDDDSEKKKRRHDKDDDERRERRDERREKRSRREEREIKEEREDREPGTRDKDREKDRDRDREREDRDKDRPVEIKQEVMETSGSGEPPPPGVDMPPNA